MAEALGAVASGITVASLLESLQKIHVLWKAIKEAPKDIGDTIEELQLLALVLSRLLKQPESNETPQCGLVQQCRDHCCKALADLNSIVSHLNRRMLASKRQARWTSIASALKKSEIHDLRQRLERSKSTLNLAISIFRLYGPLRAARRLFALSQI